jgi:4-hydroxy-4-methyl-2-oxoglutarate aldolase
VVNLPMLPEAALEQLSSAVLADVLDGLGHRTSALPANIRPLRPEWKVFGRATTLEGAAVTSEPLHPYAVEMECIDAMQPGQVLVATTQGHLGSALWGELLSTAARSRGAVGVVIDGLVRDAARILKMNFPVFATGYHPLDSKGRLDCVQHGKPIRIGDCVIKPGDWVFGDIDGIVVLPQELALTALAKAMEKTAGENRVRGELAKGRSLREVFAEYGIL